MHEHLYTVLLSEDEKKKAVHLSDGAYMIDEGYQIAIFASDGISRTPMVYLDEHAIERIYKIKF